MLGIELGRKCYTILTSNGLQLVIGGRMVLHHHGSEALYRCAGALGLRELAGFDFRHAPLSDILKEGVIGGSAAGHVCRRIGYGIGGGLSVVNHWGIGGRRIRRVRTWRV